VLVQILGKIGVNVKKRQISERQLIKAESKIGGTLFGPVPEGHRREFFCLDNKTWVWHEEWTDDRGRTQSITTRYEVRPNGVMKIQDGHRYTYINGSELHNLAQACNQYYQHVAPQVYNVPYGA
jgi:hypothetical protein